jgi:hypothetical protein
VASEWARLGCRGHEARRCTPDFPDSHLVQKTACDSTAGREELPAGRRPSGEAKDTSAGRERPSVAGVGDLTRRGKKRRYTAAQTPAGGNGHGQDSGQVERFCPGCAVLGARDMGAREQLV